MNFSRIKAVALGALALAASWVAPAPAVAGSGCSSIVTGAVLTAAQWNACFAAKQNELGYTPVNKAGDSMTGLLTTVAPTTTTAGFRLNPGTAPTAPTNGDIWTTSAGLYVQVNGSTVGPLISASSGGGITALTGDVTATGPGSVAATLATVNSNVGAFGSATQVGTFTVNGKGLITAAANVTVTPALGSITGFGTGVATALAINVGSAGAPVINGGTGSFTTLTASGATTIVGASFGLSGNISTTAWTTNGVRYKNVAATLTDTSSSGTVATAYTDVFGGNTIAASSAVTFTNYFTQYVAGPTQGTNVTITNAWAFGADSVKIGTSNQFTVSTAGAVTIGAALTYGGVTLSNAVTGTGNMVLSASPTLTGIPVLAAPTATSLALGGATIGSNALAVTGASTLNAGSAGSALVTLVDAAQSGSSFFSYPTSINGTTRELILKSGQSSLNVLGVQNTTTNGFSSFIARDNLNEEKFAIGYGNLSSTSPFAGAVYLEASSFADSVTVPPPFRIVHTGKYTSAAFGNKVRFEIDSTGKILFYKVDGTTEYLTLNAAGTQISATTNINTSSTITATGDISSSSNINVGSSGVFFWGGTRSALRAPADGSIKVSNDANTNSFTLTAPTATATPTFQLGAADASVAVAQITRVQSVVAGTAAANGANWTLIGSLPTGTGTSGDIIIQTGVKTGSGTTQGTATTALTIKGETQQVVLTGVLTAVAANFSGSIGISGGNNLTLSGGGQVNLTAADRLEMGTVGIRFGTSTNLSYLGNYTPSPGVVQMGQVTGSGAAVAQTLSVQGSSGNSAAAALFTIAGSDQTGTTTTGGETRIRGGNGTSAGGAVTIYTSATTTPAVAATFAADKSAVFAGTISATIASAATTSAVCYNTGTGLFTYNSTVGTCTVSTIRAKDLIAPLTPKEGFDLVMALEPYRYELKKDRPTYVAGEQIGFVAEDAAKVDGRVVATNPDGTVAGFRYEQYTAAITAAIKYMQAENDNIKAANDNLRSEVEALKAAR